MAKIKFKFVPENQFVSAKGWIVLGNHFIDEDENHLLSPECVTAKEVEVYVKARKAELDAVLLKARKKFKL